MPFVFVKERRTGDVYKFRFNEKSIYDELYGVDALAVMKNADPSGQHRGKIDFFEFLDPEGDTDAEFMHKFTVKSEADKEEFMSWFGPMLKEKGVIVDVKSSGGRKRKTRKGKGKKSRKSHGRNF